VNWHLLNVKESLELLGSRASGITSMEAQDRLRRHGPNRLKGKPPVPLWMLFLRQFADVMILILLAAAVVSGVIGDLKDAAVIVVIVLINAVIGVTQEYRAERALEALKKMAAPAATVLREDTAHQIAASDLVPGDIVLLEPGSVVPADLRLVESHSLRLEEASLTGESQAVEKNTTEMEGANISLADRLNMAYKGTTVAFGRGAGCDGGPGMNTELGRIAGMLQEDSSSTPLQRRLADLGRRLSLVILAICSLLYGIGSDSRRGSGAHAAACDFNRSGRNTRSSSRRGVDCSCVRRPSHGPPERTHSKAASRGKRWDLSTYVCSDKTGTLTQNRMTVIETWEGEKSEWMRQFGLDLTLAMLSIRMCESQLPDSRVIQPRWHCWNMLLRIESRAESMSVCAALAWVSFRLIQTESE
jgi:Ca2+-transporting ATPase